jgi:hypothetical protein
VHPVSSQVKSSQVKSSQVKSSQVKSSQVKSSQVKSSQVIQNGGRLSAAFGAHRWRERSGGQISAQPAPLDSPESGHHPHLLVLDHRGATGFNIVPFSGSLQYGNATRLQADDGSDRGHVRWLFRRAKVLVGPGDRRRRASSTRGLSSTSFGVLGLTRARQSILARQQRRLRRLRQEWSRAFLRCAPHTPSSISHACARSRHTGVSLTAAREADGWREQQKEVPAGQSEVRWSSAAAGDDGS